MSGEMEELQKKHRQEYRDLQSRMTRKKKSATKKTRKGVNDECAQLEQQLKEQQARELAHLNGELHGEGYAFGDSPLESADEQHSYKATGNVSASIEIVFVQSSPSSHNGSVKKPNRQKARQARKAAQQEAAIEQAEKEAANLPDLREKEIRAMREAYQSRGLEEHDIRSDGHCLYAAVADQLTDAGLELDPAIKLGGDPADAAAHLITRQVAASYISAHPDDFEPFLEEKLEGYVRTIRETGEWGGHLEILALAKAYNVDINVLQGDGKVESIKSCADGQRKPLWLAYYRHSHGLGEHYNSLRGAK